MGIITKKNKKQPLAANINILNFALDNFNGSIAAYSLRGIKSKCCRKLIGLESGNIERTTCGIKNHSLCISITGEACQIIGAHLIALNLNGKGRTFGIACAD
jgi:hypothetical protein